MRVTVRMEMNRAVPEPSRVLVDRASVEATGVGEVGAGRMGIGVAGETTGRGLVTGRGSTA